MDDSNIQFPNSEYIALQNQSLHGEKARSVQDGNDWKWLQEFIFGAIFDEALIVLRNAKTDEDRLKAQQMFLACEKPKRQLEMLISQGDAARAALKQLSEEQSDPRNNPEEDK